MKKIDIGAGVALILLIVLVFLQAGSYGKATIYGYGPDFYPRFLAVVMIACGLILILQAARGRALVATESIDPKGFVRIPFFNAGDWVCHGNHGFSVCFDAVSTPARRDQTDHLFGNSCLGCVGYFSIRSDNTVAQGYVRFYLLTGLRERMLYGFQSTL